MANPSELNQKIYHERQHHMLCLLHALNNAFQREEFTKAELDEICEGLNASRWLNPHRSWLGLGDYDVNVLLASLHTRDLTAVWFNRRLSTTQINHEKVIAYIFNVPSTNFIPFMNGRHWFTVLKLGRAFFNLDSKLREPSKIDDFVLFANALLAEGNQLFLITRLGNVDSCIITEEKENKKR